MKKLSKKAQEFEDYMIDGWADCYYDLAGCKHINNFNSNDVDERYRDAIEFAVYDEYCKDNDIYIGYNEEGPVIEKVTASKIQKQIDKEHYDKDSFWKPTKKIDKKINGLDLIKRYGWVTLMFRWIDDVNEINPNSFLAPEIFKEEKDLLKNDPYLAMYWLIRFGFCTDIKYNEVSTIIKENGLEKTLPFISNVLAFFEETDSYYEIKIPDHFNDIQSAYNGDSSKNLYMNGLYLKRRAYIIFVTQSYKNENGNLEKILDSVFVYPEVEIYLFHRIYWLIIHLHTNNLFTDIDKLLLDKNKKNIEFIYGLLKYFDKNTSKTEAEKFVKEFFEHIFNNQDTYLDEPFYIQELLLNSGFSKFTEKKELKKVSKTYFDKGSEGYNLLKKVWKG